MVRNYLNPGQNTQPLEPAPQSSLEVLPLIILTRQIARSRQKR